MQISNNMTNLPMNNLGSTNNAEQIQKTKELQAETPVNKITATEKISNITSETRDEVETIAYGKD
jgi:hypothetical protein